eukprot:1905624-Amphidinium_carterae.1
MSTAEMVSEDAREEKASSSSCFCPKHIPHQSLVVGRAPEERAAAVVRKNGLRRARTKQKALAKPKPYTNRDVRIMEANEPPFHPSRPLSRRVSPRPTVNPGDTIQTDAENRTRRNDLEKVPYQNRGLRKFPTT